MQQQTPIYAGFKMRAGAILLDGVLLFMLSTPLLLLVYGTSYFGEPSYGGLLFSANFPDDGGVVSRAILPFYLLIYSAIYGADAAAAQFAGVADILINCLLPMVAVIAFWLARGATPGKMWLGMKIVDAKTDAPPSLWQCIARYLGYFVSAFLLLGFLWVARDPKKQGWHDKLAGTMVVFTSAATAAKAEETLC